MRKLGIALLVIIVLVVAAVLAIPYLVDVNRYHNRIQTELQQRLGRPVSLGEMHLRVIPLSIRVENPIIGEDPRFGGSKPFAQAEELRVSAELFPLLRGEVQVNSLELMRPRIELIKNREGVWNFSTLGQQPQQPAAEPAKPSAGKPTAPQQPQPAPQEQAKQPLTLKDLKISDGQVAMTDFQKNQPRSVYDHIDLRLIDFAPDKPFMVEAAAHLPGQGTQQIKLTGKGGPINRGSPINTPFKGTLELKEVSLSAVQKFANSQALSGMDAVASGKADLDSNGSKLQSSGSLKLDKPRVRNIDIGYPIAADYSLSDDLNQDLLRIDKGNLKLGSTPVSITGTVNLQPTPALLDVRLNTSDVSIDEVARLASAFGVAFNPNMKISGRINADLRAKGSAKEPVLNGKLSAANLSMSGKDLPQPVQVQNIDLVMTPQEIRSNQFSAKSGSTTLMAQFTLGQYANADARKIDANIKTANARLGELINIAKAYGVSGTEGVSGDGSLSLDVRASGPLKNTSAMTFAGSGALQNAQLKSPNIAEPIKVGNANIRFSQNSVVLENLAASIGQSNLKGNLTMKNFAAPQVQFALGADKIIVAEWQKIFQTGPAQPGKVSDFWQFVSSANAAVPSDSFVNRITGSGSLNAGNITYDQVVMSNVKANVNLDRGMIKLNPVTSQIFGGTQTGNIAIDTRTTPVTYAMQSKLEKVDANQMLSSISKLKNTLYGVLNANAQTNFASGGEEIVRTLNGRTSLNLTNGKLANVDLLYQLANVGKFLNTGKTISQKNFTSLVKLTGDFDVKNGVAQTNNLQAVTDAGTMAAQGLVNLADQTLNMKVMAVLPKDLSAQVGGSGIGGMMSTALANKNGELVMPVLVTGNFQSPHIAPDLETIARMKMENLLPTGANPGKLSSGILGSILGGKSQNQSLPQNDQNGVQGVLDQLRGKQPQQQPPAGNQPPAQPNGTQPQQQQSQTGQQPQQQKKQGWADVLQGVLDKNKKQQQQQQPPPDQQQQQQPQQQQQQQPPQQEQPK